MSDASSPLKAPNKVTYAARAKRRRSTVDKTYKNSGGESDGSSGEEETPVQPVTRQTSQMAARTPKKVDVYLPGPSPKQTPAQSVSAKKPVSIRGKRGTHSRQGSVASLAREDTLVGEDSPTKPVSSVKPRSTIGRADTEDADDGSVAGEPRGRYTSRKNEAERRQFLEEDVNSGEVEAHRVFCKACNDWIDLNPSRRYIMKNWVEHRKSCKTNSERSESPSKEKTTEQVEDDDASVADGSVVDATTIRRIKKEEDRKSFIENDPLSGEVKPDAAFCKGCETWVKLSTHTRYSLHPWKAHVQKCSGATKPGSKVAAAQRKLALVNDPQAHNFSNESVECKVCNETVGLGRQLDYDLTKWEEHKLTCSLPVPPPITKPATTMHAATPRPPPSVASTEETIVAAEAGTPGKNKRSREDDDAPERTVRQRGKSYEAPQGDAPGFLNWIAAPLKNFLREFREGLSG